MPEDWSENVFVAHLADDPALGDELDSLERDTGDTPAVTSCSTSRPSRSSTRRTCRNSCACAANSTRASAASYLADVRPDVWSTFLVSGLDKVFRTAESVPLALAGIQLLEAAD